jgi:hypothetical protein
MRRHSTLAALGACWAGLTAFAPPPAPQPSLEYALDDTGSEAQSSALADVQPVEPGEQYPPSQQDRTVGAASEQGPPAPAPVPVRPKIWTLSIDASVTADSNVTNGSDLDEIPVEIGGQILPVALDPRLRQRDGIGLGVSAVGGVKLPIADDVALTADAEGWLLEHDGGDTDDAALLVAVGGELTSKSGRLVSIQAIAFERWYGGIAANEGLGLRGRFRQPVGGGAYVTLDVDARVFDSDYGDDYGGRQASLYLVYQKPLTISLSGSLGIFARREWLEADPFSSLELGAYGGLSRYLSVDLTGGLSLGVSRLRFDGPILFLSPDPRRDWHYSASLYLAARRPLAWGFSPSMTYTYNRTDSSIAFYRSDRHRMRLGLLRRF